MKKVIIALIIIMVIGGIWYRFFYKKKDLEPSGNVEMGEVPVEVCIAAKDNLISYIDAEGVAEAKNTQNVITETDGYITLKVKDGDIVKKGDLLAVIENENISINFENAVIDYQKSYADIVSMKKAFVNDNFDYKNVNQEIDDNYEKFKNKIEKKVSETIDKGDKNLYFRIGDKELALKRAYRDYKKLFLYAKYDGIVGNISVKDGEHVNPGTVVMKVDDLSEITLKMNVIEEDISRIRKGSKVYCNFVALKDTFFVGTVDAVNKFIDSEKHLGYIRVKLANQSKEIVSGMYCYAKIEAETKENVLLVPKKSLLFRENRPMVFTVTEGRSYWRFVETIGENIFFTGIKEGISEGDTVITTNNYTMIHDAPIKIEKVKKLKDFINFKETK